MLFSSLHVSGVISGSAVPGSSLSYHKRLSCLDWERMDCIWTSLQPPWESLCRQSNIFCSNLPPVPRCRPSGLLFQLCLLYKQIFYYKSAMTCVNSSFYRCITSSQWHSNSTNSTWNFWHTTAFQHDSIHSCSTQNWITEAGEGWTRNLEEHPGWEVACEILRIQEPTLMMS